MYIGQIYTRVILFWTNDLKNTSVAQYISRNWWADIKQVQVYPKTR